MKMNEFKKRVELYEDNKQALDNMIKWAKGIIEDATALKEYNEQGDTDHKSLNRIIRDFNTDGQDIQWTTDAIWVVWFTLKDLHYFSKKRPEAITEKAQELDGK